MSLDSDLYNAANANNMTLVNTILVNQINTTTAPTITQATYNYALGKIAANNAGTLARDFMAKVGGYVTASAVVDALNVFTVVKHNYVGQQGILDYSLTFKAAIAASPALVQTMGQILNQTTIENLDAVTTSNNVRYFMSKMGSVVPADWAVTAIMNAVSLKHNYLSVDAITDNITAEQKTTISNSPTMKNWLGQTLDNLVFENVTATTGAANVADFMSKMGSLMPADWAVTAIMDAVNLKHNYGMVDGITDYLTDAQKASISLSPTIKNWLGETLDHLVFENIDATTSANNIRDFMSKVGSLMPADWAVTAIMDAVSLKHNYGIVDAITDYLTAAQKTEISNNPTIKDWLGQTLDNLVFENVTATTGAANIADFMLKMGSLIPADWAAAAIHDAISLKHNYGMVDAITDYLTAAQKTEMSSDTWIREKLGSTLDLLVYENVDAVTSANNIRDFMSKVGIFAPGDYTASAIYDAIALKHNYGIVDAITDYLTASQKAEIANNPQAKQWLGEGLFSLVLDNGPAANVSDFMSKIGSLVPTDIAVNSMDNAFSLYHNYAVVDSITDYLSASQKAEIAASVQLKNQLSDTFRDIFFLSSNDPVVSANNIRDFMSKVGSLINVNAAVMSISDAVYNLNYGMVDAITDYLTAAQKTEIGNNAQLKLTLGEVLGDLVFQNGTDATVAANITDFMSKLGSVVDTTKAVHAIVDAANYTDNYGIIDGITDYLTTNQKTEIGNNAQLKLSLGQALRELVFDSGTDTTIANNVRDFMLKVGSVVDTTYAVQAIVDAANYTDNYGIIDGITDYLTAIQKTEIGNNAQLKLTLGQALRELVFDSGTDTTIANNVRDFMSKVGSVVDTTYAVQAIKDAADYTDNYAIIDGITDYLTATQKTEIGNNAQLKITLGDTLHELVFDSGSVTAVGDNVRDFLSKVGSLITTDKIVYAMTDAGANGHNYAAVDAISDFVTSAMKTQIGSSATMQTQLGVLLKSASVEASLTLHDRAEVVNDLMQKVGVYIPTADIGTALQNFASSGNWSGDGAIFDNLTAFQFSNVPASVKTALTAAGLTIGTYGIDKINGVAAADKIYGLDGNDTIDGNGGNDFIYGGAGNDKLTGGTGDDLISGGSGSDLLYGNGGADTFLFTAVGQGVDTIKDFSKTAGDKLDLSAMLDKFNPVTDAIQNFVITTTVGYNTVVSVDVDGAAGPATRVDVAIIEGVKNLTAVDLLANGNLII